MYDVNAVRRMILKYGVTNLISYLSGNLDEGVKTKFEQTQLLVNGYPNLCLIYSLV